jgi:hypothetical protein
MFDPFGFCCRNEPPWPGYHWPFRNVRLTHGRKKRLAVRDIRAIRALPRVDEFCCAVPIAMPARDPFAAPRQAAWTCPGEHQQVLFSGPGGRYASVTLTNASDADERSGLSRNETKTHQDDESDDEFNPPDTVARHVPPCVTRREYSWFVRDRFECYQAGSRVEREQPERLPACTSEHPEVALIRAQELQRSVAVRQNDDRCVRQSNTKVGVPLHDSLGMAYILGREQFELIGATRDFVDERHLCLVTDPAANQIVQFREHKG